jgi:CBS domain containing-hemolysin-like protein
MEEVPILILLLLLSGFFSGAEIALFSLSPEKIQAIKNTADHEKILNKIARLESIKKDSNKLLVTILIGNNVVNIGASSIATVVAMNFAEQLGGNISSNTVIGSVTGIMTFLILIFGEITPKAFCHKHALTVSLFSAPIIRFLEILLYPIVVPIAMLTEKFTGKKPSHGLSEQELKAALELSEREGSIESAERELVENALDFNEHSVEMIMTPRSKIFALADNTAVPEALPKIAEQMYSRVPIFHDTLDEIVGILRVQSIIEEMLKPDFLNKNLANLSLISPLRVPRTMKIDTLLRVFQEEKQHLAFVYDEHGGLIGLITLEDVVEEIFGEIQDEEDTENVLIRRIGRYDFLCNSEIELEQIEKFLAAAFPKEFGKSHARLLPWKLDEENATLAYFLLDKLEHFPILGEICTLRAETHTFMFKIEKIRGERIELVRLSLKTL